MKTKTYSVRLTEAEIASVKERGGSNWAAATIRAALGDAEARTLANAANQAAIVSRGPGPVPAGSAAPEAPAPNATPDRPSCRLCGALPGEMHALTCRLWSARARA